MIANKTMLRLHNNSLMQYSLRKFKMLRFHYYVHWPDTGWDDSRCCSSSEFAWIWLQTAFFNKFSNLL